MKSLKMIMATLLVASGLTQSVFAGGVLDRIKRDGNITVSVNADLVPASFMNDSNEMDGFDVDVAKEVAKRLGVSLKVVTPEWAMMTGGKWGGRWDVAIASMVPTKRRAEVLDFVVYYFETASLAVHKDAPYKQVSELSGKKLGLESGTLYEDYAKGTLKLDMEGAPPFSLKLEQPEIVTYGTSAGAIDDLKLGDGVRLNGVLQAYVVLHQAIKAGYPIRILDEVLFRAPQAISMERGDKELHETLAKLVEDMKNDGTLTKLSNKWYGADLTIADQSTGR